MALDGTSDSRVAIVTGAGSGIGAAIVDRLSSNGWEIVAVDLTFPTTASQSPRAKRFTGDITKDSTIEEVLDEARKLGTVRGLVNAAGVREYREFSSVDRDFLQKHLEVNVIAPYQWIKRLAGEWIERNVKGSVVNVTSVMADRVVLRNSAYCLSKAALASLTKSAALEFSSAGIRVNSVAPGPTDTPMLATLGEQALAEIADRLPMRRLGQPEEVSEAVAFLLESADFTTGSTIYVDGGYLVS